MPVPTPVVHKETAIAVSTPVHKETETLVPAPNVHNETDVPPPPPTVYNGKRVPRRSQSAPLQNKMLLSTQIDDAPKTASLTDFEDPLRPVQVHQAYYRVQFQRYKEGLRSISPTFKMTINTKWFESYLMFGCYKKYDGSKGTYE